MVYQERLVARKRLFGTNCPSLSENGEATTIPLPLSWDYIRSYWPKKDDRVSKENPLMPHEVRNKSLWKFTKRFEY